MTAWWLRPGRAWCAVAGLLAERSGDPDVERLLEGFAFLTGKLREKLDDELPVILMTAFGSIQMAVEAMKNGAMDFIEKPFSKETILESIGRAVDRAGANYRAEQNRTRVVEALALLSDRERQVLAGVLRGLPNKVIAFELGISPRTVEGYRATVMAKMQARTLAELVRMTMDAGIDLADVAT